MARRFEIDQSHRKIELNRTEAAAIVRKKEFEGGWMIEDMVEAFDRDTLRRCFSRFATGVTVITTVTNDGEKLGITANSFSSVSLDPPLILFCLDVNALSSKGFLSSSHFSVNILAKDQQDVSQRFARRMGSKWSETDIETRETGVPLIAGAMAQIECRTYSSHVAGDHVILIGEVVALNLRDNAEPLLFFGSRYGDFLPR